jgi:hypothetical protein
MGVVVVVMIIIMIKVVVMIIIECVADSKSWSLEGYIGSVSFRF